MVAFGFYLCTLEINNVHHLHKSIHYSVVNVGQIPQAYTSTSMKGWKTKTYTIHLERDYQKLWRLRFGELNDEDN